MVWHPILAPEVHINSPTQKYIATGVGDGRRAWIQWGTGEFSFSLCIDSMRHSLTTSFTSQKNPDITEDDNCSLTTPFSCQQDIDLPEDDIRHQQEGLDTMGDR